MDLIPPTTEVEFVVRDYCAADFDRLWQIDQLCFQPGIAYTQMELSGFITRRNAVTLVGEFPPDRDDHASLQPPGNANPPDRVAGFVVAQPIRSKYGHILTLDILAEARRSGLATKLMTLCEQRLRSAGCVEVYLETAVDNAPALRLYGKLGYEILRTLPDYYSSHSLDAFQMRKAL